MVLSNTAAYAKSLKSKTNVPGTCQLWTRTQFEAPSAGDRDGDKDADANDGWQSEPVSARVLGDRNPPVGAPLYFKNADGSGFGHRCIATGKGSGARSTDMKNGRYSKGSVSNTTIEQLEKSMGLKYVGWSRTITGIPIPGLEKKPAPKPPTKKPTPKPAKLKTDEIMVRMGHISMQFSDTVAQRRKDALTIFEELDKAQWWVTGTEALERETRQALTIAAKKYGWTIYFGAGTDAWAAVKNEVMVKGSFKGYTGPVIIPGRKGKHAAKKVVRVEFVNKDLGHIGVYPVHNVLGTDPEGQKKHMVAVGKDAAKFAKGGNLAFMGADGNVQDAKKDPAFGNGFISCWDEKKEYPSTGHGCIDYIFRWKGDGRVRFFNAVSKSDVKLPLHTDHFPVFAAYPVRKLKK